VLEPGVVTLDAWGSATASPDGGATIAISGPEKIVAMPSSASVESPTATTADVRSGGAVGVARLGFPLGGAGIGRSIHTPHRRGDHMRAHRHVRAAIATVSVLAACAGAGAAAWASAPKYYFRLGGVKGLTRDHLSTVLPSDVPVRPKIHREDAFEELDGLIGLER